MAMKTCFSGRDEVQVQAMAEEANRTGSQEGDPQNLREHLNEIPLEVPAALEGNFSKAEGGMNEVSSYAFFVIISQFIHNTCC